MRLTGMTPSGILLIELLLSHILLIELLLSHILLIELLLSHILLIELLLKHLLLTDIQVMCILLSVYMYMYCKLLTGISLEVKQCKTNITKNYSLSPLVVILHIQTSTHDLVSLSHFCGMLTLCTVFK